MRNSIRSSRLLIVVAVATVMAIPGPADAQANRCYALYRAKNGVGGHEWAGDIGVAKGLALAACRHHNGGAGTSMANTCTLKEAKCSKKN